jgi:hypothetical protein
MRDTFASVEITEQFYLLVELAGFLYVEINLVKLLAVVVAVAAFRFTAIKFREARGFARRKR